MEINHRQIRQKVLQGAQTLQVRADSDVVLRPSASGYCPTRLWKETRERQAGVREADDPERAWPALQGQYNEELVALLLRLAGATVLTAPSTKELASIPGGEQADEVFGVPTHVDGAIYWPEELGPDWLYLEFKDMRAVAQIKLALDGLYNDRGYWYQAVSYLMRGHNALLNNSRVPSTEAWDWMKLRAKYPDGLPGAFFVSVAKDPSSAKMMLRGMTDAAKYEDEDATGKKMNAKQLAMKAVKEQRRARLDELGGIDFFFQLIRKDDESVRAAWADITALPAAMKAETPPSPIHDPMLTEEELDDECRWYCPHAEWCRNLQLTNRLQLDPFRGLVPEQEGQG